MNEKLYKSYSDKNYIYTTIVSHQGTVVAFAMDDRRHIYYSVLNLDSNEDLGEFDAAYWLEQTEEVPFPDEIAQVGYSLVGYTSMPTVKEGGIEATEGEEVDEEDIDTWLSSTARLTADVPFQVMSDNSHIYLFRQAIAHEHDDMVYKLESGAAAGNTTRNDVTFLTDEQDNNVPIANSTLLVDRFVLADGFLKSVLEVRYRRSRQKTVPLNNYDSLGTKDMDNVTFYEPTQELDFIGNLTGGYFTVTLLPTQVTGLERWQIFAYNQTTSRMDSFNIERDSNGLFNTQGSRLYTSPEQQYQDSVLEREPGICPFTNEPLVPVISTSDYAEWALEFDGTDDCVAIDGLYYDTAGSISEITVEAWIKTDRTNDRGMVLSFDRSEYFRIEVYSSNKVLWATAGTGGDLDDMYGAIEVTDGQWHHLATTYYYDANAGVGYKAIYIDGVQDGETKTAHSSPLGTGETRYGFIGAGSEADVFNGGKHDYFKGQIDEVRIWNLARSESQISEEKNYRLIGNESSLVAYYRLDEGSGTTIFDQTNNSYNGISFSGNSEAANWVGSDAPVGDNPGVRRSSFTLEKQEVANPRSVLKFDGENDYVDCGSSPSLTDSIAVEAWVQHDAGGGNGHIVNCGGGWSDRGYSLYWYNGKIRVELQSANSKTVCDNTVPGDDEWHHIAFTWDKVSGKITTYINAKAQANTKEFTDSLGTPNQNLNIGRNQKKGVYFSGQIAEIRLWNVARSPEEIKENIYASLNGTEEGLVRYYPSNEGTGSSITDGTGSEANGTIQGATWETIQTPKSLIIAPPRTLFYFQQEPAESGHNGQEKPLKRQARLMLSLPTIDYSKSDGLFHETYLSVLDFGVSRTGKLALVPDSLQLSALEDGSNAIVEELNQKEEEYAQLESLLNYGAIQLVPSEPEGYTDVSKFGEFVAISDEWLVASAQVLKGSDSSEDHLALYFFRWIDREWREEQIEIVARIRSFTSDEGDFPVSMSGDRVIVGNEFIGKVFIYHYEEGSWLQKATFSGPRFTLATKTEFGNEVAISGNFAVVNQQLAQRINGSQPTEPGVVHIYEYDGSNWSEKNSLQRNEYAYNITLSDNRLALHSYDGGQVIQVYEYSDNTWAQMPGSPLNPEDLTEDNIAGYSSLAIDGDYILTGFSFRPSGSAGTQGVVYSFHYDGSSWVLQDRLEETDEESSGFGLRLEMSADRAVIGAFNYSGNNGRVSAFYRSDDTWNRTQIIDNTNNASLFGQSISINDISQIAIGQRNAVMLEIDTAPVNRQLTALAAEIAALELQLNDSSNITLPLSLLHTDTAGLTIYGDRLSFAPTQDAAFLLESASGQLGLYFRDREGQYSVARYNLETERATISLSTDNEEAYIIARNPGSAWSSATVNITDGSDADHCHVTLSGNGITETWSDIPRDGEEFAAVLNGDFDYDEDGEANYDYQQAGNRATQGYSLKNGSLLFRAVADGESGKIQNGSLAVSGTLENCAWVADSPGKAVRFDGVNDCAIYSTPAELATDDDLTIEAWINPSSDITEKIARLVHHHTNRCKYTLGIHKGINDYRVFVQVSDRGIQSSRRLTLGEWHHVAAVFNQSYALKFDGTNDYVDCGTGNTLDIAGDLTIEAVIQANNSNTLGIFAKGTAASGAGEEYLTYGLYVEGGKLVFEFEDTDGKLHQLSSSDASIATGSVHKVAVVRREVTEETDSGEVVQELGIYLYVDGHMVGNKTIDPAVTAGTNNASATIGLVNENYFEGAISEVRFWNQALADSDIHNDITGSESGLVSWWQLEEAEESVASDYKNQNTGSIKGATWIVNPDASATELNLYFDGEAITTFGYTENNWGNEQFTLGGRQDSSDDDGFFHGYLDEIRLWKNARSPEEILDNMFGRLYGERRDLIAYYKVSEDDEGNAQIADSGLKGLHLTFPSNEATPDLVLSTAPVGSDIPSIRPVLATLKNNFHDTIDSAPAVAEYSDLQRDEDGSLKGILKRCHSYIKDGQWYLVTGYKVGNLLTEWVGQVQFDPQIIGYVEGLPPVPMENLTDPDVNLSKVSYMDVTEANEVSYTISSTQEGSYNSTFNSSLSVGYDFRSDITVVYAPYGLGWAMSKQALDLDFAAKVNTSLSSNYGWSSEESVGDKRSTTRNLSLVLAADWDEDLSYYVPRNKGFAVVQSETADVYALRLEHNNAMVALRVLPNADIPPDWNLIPFDINPRYTLQGSLDGKVGTDEHPNFPGADQGRQHSYRKYSEAYALKEQIRRDEQELENYYNNFDTSTTSNFPSAWSESVNSLSQSIGSGFDSNSLLNSTSSKSKLPERIAKRNIVNTYVWTADGGFFSESTETTDVRSESTNGSYAFSWSSGGGIEVNTSIWAPKVSFELDASVGGSMNFTKSRTKESSESFGISVDLYALGCDGNEGQVDAYRFNTFYLEPDSDNFDDFFGKIVDPIWLAGNSYYAWALRQAKQSGERPACWRVFHRVTYISRILPDYQTNDGSYDDARTQSNISSNWELIRRLDPYCKRHSGSLSELSTAVKSALKKYLPELYSHYEQIVEYMAEYYGLEV